MHLLDVLLELTEALVLKVTLVAVPSSSWFHYSPGKISLVDQAMAMVVSIPGMLFGTCHRRKGRAAVGALVCHHTGSDRVLNTMAVHLVQNE